MLALKYLGGETYNIFMDSQLKYIVYDEQVISNILNVINNKWLFKEIIIDYLIHIFQVKNVNKI